MDRLDLQVRVFLRRPFSLLRNRVSPPITTTAELTTRNREAHSARPSAGVHAHHTLRHVNSVREAAEEQEARTLMNWTPLKIPSRGDYAYRICTAITV